MKLSALTDVVIGKIMRRGHVGDHRKRSGSLGARNVNSNYASRMSYLERHRVTNQRSYGDGK